MKNSSIRSERFDLARIYFLNVREFYNIFVALANCIAKRMRLNKEISIDVLASSRALSVLASKLNNYSLLYDGIKCVESGDMIYLAQYVINEAREIVDFDKYC